MSTTDSHNRAKTALGICLIVGPLMLLVSALISPDTDRSNKLKELAAIAAHKSTYVLGGVLFMVGSLVLLGAAIGLIRLFRGSKLGQTAGWLLAIGSTVPVGWYALGFAEYQMATLKGVDRVAMANLLHKADSAAGLAPLIVMFVVGIVVGSILLAIAARRQRIVPLWVSIAIGVSGILGFVSNNNQALSIVDFAVLLVGLGMLGWTVIKMSDADWDTAGERPLPPAGEAPGAPAPATA